MTQLRPYYDDIRALNTEVIVISFETGYWLQVWLAEMEAPFPLLLDPARKADRPSPSSRFAGRTQATAGIL
ncbi:MAG: redoxin domain-containing protein [Anaerolineales bacterium]|nr:redoxin domain-containing protein [Anaerolineales bacterium]